MIPECARIVLQRSIMANKLLRERARTKIGGTHQSCSLLVGLKPSSSFTTLLRSLEGINEADPGGKTQTRWWWIRLERLTAILGSDF